MKSARLLFALLLLFATPALTQSATSPGIELAGALVAPGTITRADLLGLPAVEMDVQFKTSKGDEKAHYKGVLLWEVFQRHGMAGLPGHHEELKHTFLVTAKDGYQIAYSFGEIAPEFGNRQIILAYERDGKAIADDGLRIVVPGDIRGARSVRDVVRIEVR